MPMLKDDYQKTEKINGVIYNMTPAANFRHGIVNGNIYARIREGLKNSLCLAFIENLDYKYHPDINDDYVVPDVMIVCDRKALKSSAYHGTPKFIVETLSPATAFRDKTEKKDIYEEAGVSEYWIVSPRERAVEIYYLQNGKYKLVYSYILQDEKDEKDYNADTLITLREVPHVTMTLEEIFDKVD